VTRTGTAGGTYTASPATLTIDAVTGAITPGTSTAGSYTVTYTIAASGGCSAVTATAPVTITTAPSATISYSGTPFCTSVSTPQLVTRTGTAGGTYTASPATLTIDVVTGAITPGTSTAGSYTVTYTIAASGGCSAVTATTTVTVNACFKTLNLTSVMLEGLYSGGGTMRQAWDALGPHWPAGIADHIKVELHSSGTYSTIVYTATDVPLSTTGNATISVPAAFNGSYFITIRHRNSVETTTSTAISFAGSTINQSFGAPANVFGGNLGVSHDGHYLIYGGDVDQDGFVGVIDMSRIDNQSSSFGSGYLPEDVDGDGFVGVLDMSIVDNNSTNFVSSITP
jgi:PKD repeat protein